MNVAACVDDVGQQRVDLFAGRPRWRSCSTQLALSVARFQRRIERFFGFGVAQVRGIRLNLLARLNDDHLIFDHRDRQTECQVVKRGQKIPKLFRAFTGPRSGSASAFCSGAVAGVMRAEPRPVKRNCLRCTITSTVVRPGSSAAALTIRKRTSVASGAARSRHSSSQGVGSGLGISSKQPRES